MKTIERVLLFGAGLLLSLNFLHAAPTLLSAQSVPVGELESSQVQSIGGVQPAQADSIVQITAESQGLEPVAPADLPKYGTYWQMMPGGVAAPFPCPPDDPSLPVYQIAGGQFLVDETGGQVAVNSRRFGLQATSSTVASALAAEADAVVNLINQVQAAQFNRELAAVMGFDEELDSPDTFSPMLAVYDTNLLWLEITNVSNGWSYLNLHNATNQVYAIWSTTNLLTSWNVETELWPTNGAVMPFTVPTLDRQNLFVRAEDWTSIDSNGDGIPDWWVWLYFGNLNETATNLDSQGNTLGYDYTNGLDPNIIQFFLVVTNRHVSTTFAPMQFNITAGVPSSLAVLVNSTNFSGAAWTGYSSSNVVVSLGSTDGDYNVWVGLRGRVTNSQQLWQGVTFTLDRVSPTVVITNPALTTVSKPVIQLQGYVSEPLASLTYDLTNAAGRITNQPAYIIGQFVDTNTWKFTTNYFQCYDVALTNGANLITLHALDLAGNTTTVNTTLTLDYSGATNPPAITLTWPTTNSVIAGTSFTLQGLLDDDTATVTVSGLGTNKFTGLVERGGRFTVPNLPLPNLTNVLTIAATNAAGHGRTVPLTALKSAVTVTMDAIPAAALSQEFVTVTGTIGDLSHDVYVNGVQATVSGDPTWEAAGVPVISDHGSGQFDIEIYPSGSDPSSTPSSGSLKAVVTLPPVVQAASYVAKVLFDEIVVTCHGSSGETVIKQNEQWNSGTGGSSAESVSYGPGSGGGESDAWPDYWPEYQPWENLSSEINGPSTVDVTCGTAQRTITRQASTAIQLVAGGPAQAGVQQLIHLLASAAGYSDLGMNTPNGNFYDDPGLGFGDIPVPASSIQILGQTLTPTVTNAYVGETYVVLPAGAAQNLPVNVTGTNSRAYSFGVQPEPGLIIVDGNSGTNLTLQTNTVIVGQQMNLICKTITTNGPTLSNFQWTVPGFAITNFYVSSDAFQTNGYPVLLTATNNQGIYFWWADGATNRVVQCSATVNGQRVTAQATFNVLRPAAQISTKTSSVELGWEINRRWWGICFGTNGGAVGISFSNTITMPPGRNYNLANTNYDTEWVQLINNYSFSVTTTPDGTNHILRTSGTVLDDVYPYQITKTTEDSPSVGQSAEFESAGSIAQDSTMWLMFKPSGGRWVPLKTVNWKWSGGVSLSGTNLILTSRNWSTNPPAADAWTTYPIWTNNQANTNAFNWNPPL